MNIGTIIIIIIGIICIVLGLVLWAVYLLPIRKHFKQKEKALISEYKCETQEMHK